METNIVIMLFAVALAGYFIGAYFGFRAGQNDNNGWEDEARWWRKNTADLVDYENRSNDD